MKNIVTRLHIKLIKAILTQFSKAIDNLRKADPVGSFGKYKIYEFSNIVFRKNKKIEIQTQLIIFIRENN